MDQLALFEDLSAPKAYVPKQEHVINRLRRILAQLQAAEVWPWEPVIVKLYKESTLPQLYGLVADEAQAESFKNSIAQEVARLDKGLAQAADGHRNGAVRERSQVHNPKTDTWTKRDTNTGKFMDQKAD